MLFLVGPNYRSRQPNQRSENQRNMRFWGLNYTTSPFSRLVQHPVDVDVDVPRTMVQSIEARAGSGETEGLARNTPETRSRHPEQSWNAVRI